MQADNHRRRTESYRVSRRRLIRMTAVGSAAASAWLAACSSRAKPNATTSAPAGAQSPRAGGTIHTYINVNPDNLDPQKTRSIPAQSVAGHVMSRPFRHKTGLDPNVTLSRIVENDLAVKAESPDAVTWTITLRQDAKFQNIAPVNGHAVEAEDVKTTFARGLTIPESAIKANLVMMDANQIEAPSPNVVVFKLKFPYAVFPQTLTGSAFIHPREVTGGQYDPSKQPIGCGPFIFESFTPDVGLSYKKNPDWFDKPRPYIDADRTAIIPDAAQQVAQFSAGNLDELVVSPNDLDTIKRSSPKATVVAAPDPNPYIIYGHMDDPNSAYRDDRIRQAISMSIDREALGKAVFNGTYHNNGVLPFAMGKAALPPDQLGNGSKYFTYNLAEAKRLVDASGLGGQLHKLVYPQHAYGPTYEALAQAINPMLNAAGIKTQLVAVDYLREFLNPKTGIAFGHYDVDTLVVAPLFLGAQAPEESMFTSLTPGYNANHSRVNDPDLTTMLKDMMAMLDENQRLKKLQDAQRYVAEKLYFIMGIPSGNQYLVAQPRIQGYSYSLLPPTNEGSEVYSKIWLTS